jgi:hypothetical protein
MLKSKCGTLTATYQSGAAFFPILNMGNTIDGTTGNNVTVKNIFIEVTGETGTADEDMIVSLVAYYGTTAVTLDTTACAQDAIAIDNFTTEIALGKGSTYVNKIGYSIPSRSTNNAGAPTSLTIKYIINYE